jgi:hypothetical protein
MSVVHHMVMGYLVTLYKRLCLIDVSDLRCFVKYFLGQGK